MSEQIIDSLKEWFENEWLYERHLTSELIKDKEAFQSGCKSFDDKNYSFEGELKIVLRKESGLAEVARINKNLEKYATHCFKQVEKVLSEFMLVNPGRQKIGEYLLDGRDMIQNPMVIDSLNPSINKSMYHLNDDGTHNSNCLILKLNHILKEGNYYYQAPDPNGLNSKVKSLQDKHWHINQKEYERIFKAVLWYNTFGKGWSVSANSNKAKPAFQAFGHMSFFRNVGSHLNSENKPFQMPKSDDPAQNSRLKIFYENPLLVMDNQLEAPGFYMRYVDMVLFLYSEFLKTSKL
jgi:hypothetical protein